MGDSKQVGAFARRHLTALQDLSRDEVTDILDTAQSFRSVMDRPVKKVPSLQGVTVCNAFFEPSTRTRLSFELAEKRQKEAQRLKKRKPKGIARRTII